MSKIDLKDLIYSSSSESSIDAEEEEEEEEERKRRRRETESVAAVFLSVLLCVFAYAMAAEKYTTKYDNIDLDQILKSDRLLNNYVNCLLDAGNCTPDGKELKKSLPDALATDCSKCSEKQKNGSEKVIRYLVNERPKLWEKLAAKYDPTGEYKVKFQNEADKHGIKL